MVGGEKAGARTASGLGQVVAGIVQGQVTKPFIPGGWGVVIQKICGERRL